jgi:very-short-patch-repair endonuclease
LALLHALGEGWSAELAVKTEAGYLNGIYPNCYKVDIGNKNLKIAIEIDGGSHCSLSRKNQDLKKTKLLTSLGWKVLRLSNQKALELYTTFTSVDTLLTSLMEF